MQIFNIPNLLTAMNLVCGIISIIFSLSGRVDLAVFPIFGSLIFDYLDGFSARLLNQFSAIGKELDSLADMVSFGLAPGIWMLVLLPSLGITDLISLDGATTHYYFSIWFQGVLAGEIFNYLPLLTLLIPVFSMFRLAKFNIDTRQTTSFIGLPTPANTLFFMIFPLLLFTIEKNSLSLFLIPYFFHPSVLVLCIMLFSYLLIAELPLFSLKFKTYGWNENKVRYSFLLMTLIAVILLKLIAIPIIILLYLAFSVIEHKFVKNIKT
jgi:CDP-diacylglycerol---serine O-phosphatidyltransferase